jgi:hypothetical protein
MDAVLQQRQAELAIRQPRPIVAFRFRLLLGILAAILPFLAVFLIEMIWS